jgi:CRP/FNR family cyclic AMP-dependent transcriptional regulator
MSIQIFSKNRIIQGLSGKQISQLYSAGSIARTGRNEIIVEEKQNLNSLYMLLAGEILVYLPKSGHRPAEVDLATLTIGDCFGEYSLVDKRPASASIKTLSECVLYTISDDIFREYLNTDRDAGFIIYRNLLTVFVGRLRGSNAELDLFNFS